MVSNGVWVVLGEGWGYFILLCSDLCVKIEVLFFGLKFVDFSLCYRVDFVMKCFCCILVLFNFNCKLC